nr:uncharacterized protein LOC127339065 [Lolium perenne]
MAGSNSPTPTYVPASSIQAEIRTIKTMYERRRPEFVWTGPFLIVVTAAAFIAAGFAAHLGHGHLSTAAFAAHLGHGSTFFTTAAALAAASFLTIFVVAAVDAAATFSVDATAGFSLAAFPWPTPGEHPHARLAAAASVASSSSSPPTSSTCKLRRQQRGSSPAGCGRSVSVQDRLHLRSTPLCDHGCVHWASPSVPQLPQQLHQTHGLRAARVSKQQQHHSHGRVGSSAAAAPSTSHCALPPASRAAIRTSASNSHSGASQRVTALPNAHASMRTCMQLRSKAATTRGSSHRCIIRLRRYQLHSRCCRQRPTSGCDGRHQLHPAPLIQLALAAPPPRAASSSSGCGVHAPPSGSPPPTRGQAENRGSTHAPQQQHRQSTISLVRSMLPAEAPSTLPTASAAPELRPRDLRLRPPRTTPAAARSALAGFANAHPRPACCEHLRVRPHASQQQRHDSCASNCHASLSSRRWPPPAAPPLRPSPAATASVAISGFLRRLRPGSTSAARRLHRAGFRQNRPHHGRLPPTTATFGCVRASSSTNMHVIPRSDSHRGAITRTGARPPAAAPGVQCPSCASPRHAVLRRMEGCWPKEKKNHGV